MSVIKVETDIIACRSESYRVNYDTSDNVCRDLQKAYVAVFASIYVHLLVRKPNLEKKKIYANKFFHNFHLPNPVLHYLSRASGKWVSVKTEL